MSRFTRTSPLSLLAILSALVLLSAVAFVPLCSPPSVAGPSVSHTWTAGLHLGTDSTRGLQTHSVMRAVTAVASVVAAVALVVIAFRANALQRPPGPITPRFAPLLI